MDCVAINIVGGQGSLPTNLRIYKYILTMINSFTRFAVAVPIPELSYESIIHAVIGYYVTAYGTLSLMLTNQGTNFESKIY